MDDGENCFNSDFDDTELKSNNHEFNIEIFEEDIKNDIFSNSPQDYEEMKLSNSFRLSETDELTDINSDSQCIQSTLNYEDHIPKETIENEIYVDIQGEKKDTEVKDCKITQRSKVIKKFSFQSPGGSVCDICSKMVYPMEKIMMDSKCYHKICFKCCKCEKLLNPTIVTKINDSLFCKPHYIELFRKRGRYDDISANVHDAEAPSSYNIRRNVEIGNTVTKSSYSNKADDFHRGVSSRRSDDVNDQKRDTVTPNRVASATKAWGRKTDISSTDWKSNSANNNYQSKEQRRVNLGSKVKSLMTMFESNK